MPRPATTLVSLCVLALGSCQPREKSRLDTDTVVMVKDGDVEMNAAIARAQAGLAEFWSRFHSPQPGDSTFCVKVPIRDAGQTEYFWLSELEHGNGFVHGRVGNRPNLVKSVVEGQRVKVAEREVVDWTFVRGGKMHGNFTLRPMLKSLPPAQADELRALLAEP